MKHRQILRNIGCLMTMSSETGLGPMGLIHDAAMIWEDDQIIWVGPQDRLTQEHAHDVSLEFDAEKKLISPGLIDCHTHLLFGGHREQEFFQRLRGTSYEEILKGGGGISRTVKDTKATSDDVLKEKALLRLDEFLSYGVTTVEAKSGYGLSFEDEIRILSLMKSLKHPVEIVSTFMGAHVVPPEFKGDRKGYLGLICEKMIPEVARKKLAEFCDVFCDEGAFTPEETTSVLTKALQHGMKIKLHGDQLKNTGASELAAMMGAVSVDHLDQISEAGIEALARSNCVGVLIPGSVFFLGKEKYAPARELLDRGVRLALSTDCNPGTSPTTNLPLIMTFAAVVYQMSVEEIWAGVTTHAALAVARQDRGKLKPGMKADFCAWDTEAPEEVPYRFGSIRPSSVWKDGKHLF